MIAGGALSGFASCQLLTYGDLYLARYLHKEVLFVVDNVFRFVQAGSEISSLLVACPLQWVINRR